MALTDKQIEEARADAKQLLFIANAMTDPDMIGAKCARAVLALIAERDEAEKYFSPELDHPASWSMFQNHLRVLEYAKTGGKPCR